MRFGLGVEKDHKILFYYGRKKLSTIKRCRALTRGDAQSRGREKKRKLATGGVRGKV